ncbi:MAG TPA: Ig-like domain-containing protein, partial [Candidatus Saccharimonadales bacterium]|nr:Ig-like domain-containing protein [Candidatus Saccharimonadales bacterium]
MNLLTLIRNARLVQKISIAFVLALVLLTSTLIRVASAATPTFKQAKAVETSRGTTASVAFASANAVGDLLVVQVLWSNTGGVTVTDSRGNAYVAATARSTWAVNNSAQTFYAKNVAAGTNTVTATFATTLPSYAIVQAHEYAGLDKVNPVDGTSSGVGTTATANSGNVTTTAGNDLLFAGGGASGTLGTPPSGWTARLNTSGNRTADKVAATAGTYNATNSATGNQWVMQLVAFKADSGNTDTTAPTTPSSLQATVVSGSQINLSWTAATDNVGVAAYQLERCQGAGCSTFATITTLGGGVTTYNDSSLTSATSYSYRLRAADAAGNLSAYSSVASATTQAVVDTTAPTVAIIAPVTGDTVTGTVTISASAADTGTGVQSVQFFQEGVLLGEDTAAPYSYQWNTNTVANGIYHLTAVAKDNAGNVSAASDVVTVQVNNAAGPQTLKIMPLGDSLTQGGVNANLPGQMEASTLNGYRLDLMNLLSDYLIDYVGSWQVGNASLPDKDENGFSGACIMVSPCGGGTLYPQTAAWINSENPDLIIMQGGENDF